VNASNHNVANEQQVAEVGLVMGYWGKVGRRAWTDTLRALSLDTTDRVVVRLLQALAVAAVAWFVLGFADASTAVRLLATPLVVLLILPIVFVWKLIVAPSKLDAELTSQLKVETDEATRQQLIDDIAEEIRWAVDNLINPKPYPRTMGDAADMAVDFKSLQTKTDEWCERVNNKLADRSVFTHGDQVNFGSLGAVPLVQTYGEPRLDWLHSANVLRLERLREIEARARTRRPR
jgi:hypothetical protein